jgi:hypothetical protein
MKMDGVRRANAGRYSKRRHLYGEIAIDCLTA